MKYDKIEYGESVNMVTGETWRKTNVTISMGENDNPDECHQKIMDKVGEWNRKTKTTDMPELAKYIGLEILPPPLRGFERVPETNLQKEKTEIAIDNCTSLSELNSLNADALKYGLIEQFVDKIKTFK